jgi:hypothetical protein
VGEAATSATAALGITDPDLVWLAARVRQIGPS